MDKIEAIKEIIADMTDSTAVDLWNEYCREDHREDEIYPMDMLNDAVGEVDALTLVRMAYYGDFIPAADWFWFNGCGNLESAYNPRTDKKSPFCADDLASWILRNDNPLGDSDIEAVLEDDEELEAG